MLALLLSHLPDALTDNVPFTQLLHFMPATPVMEGQSMRGKDGKQGEMLQIFKGAFTSLLIL